MYDWFEERLEVQSLADDILAKFVPAHVNIFRCFGGLVLTSFLIQAASGFALTMYYQPTVLEASIQFSASSIKYISAGSFVHYTGGLQELWLYV